MLSIKLKPFLTKSLIRLGHNNDGGYIINNEILNKSKTLLTFGLADEFSFEKDYNSLKSIGNEGRKNVIKKFDVDKMCHTTFTEYKKLIELI